MPAPKTLLVQTHPQIAAQWHPTRNGNLDPSTIGTYSNRKVWWLHVDERGDLHEWPQVIRNRTYEATGCSTCRERGDEYLWPYHVPAPGASFAERAPADAIALWHPTRNGDLAPADVTLYAARHVWWQCAEGHEWIDAPKNVMHRAKSTAPASLCERICPAHARKGKVTRGVAAKPLTAALIAQFHPTRNGDLTPADVTLYDERRVWWTGECGHAWKAPVRSRAAGSGCTKCPTDAGARFAAWKSGTTKTLAAAFPHIAAEWHPTRNGDLTPADVSYGSGKRVWWRCAIGHEWENTVGSRTGRDRGCWCCQHATSLPQPEPVDPTRTLAAVDPRVAAEWHPTRNGLTTPDQVSATSRQDAWWQCAEGHAWKTQINSRAKKQVACRPCANRAERLSREAA